MLGMVLFSINLFVAGVVIGRISVGFFSVKAKEEKKWGTDHDVPVPHFDASLRKGYADLKIMAEHEKRKLEVKEFTEQNTNREIASGMVIDPGGQPLCRRCGHTVSLSFDNCVQCNNKLDWNV